MEVTLNLDTLEDEPAKVQLTDAEVSALLACDGLGYGHAYYKIKHKVFEILENEERSLTITAECDCSVTL